MATAKEKTMISFPLLQPDDIEVRVAQITQKGCQLLLYKTARTDMFYMDQMFGPDGWQDSYEVVGNMVVCKLAVWAGDHWVVKTDTGEAASITSGGPNANKALVSDALKRAGTKWGIGRELYSSPFIWAKVPTEQYGGKWKLKNPYMKFFVREIGYDSKNRINHLVITDEYSNLVYSNDSAKYPFAIIQSVPVDEQMAPVEVQKVLHEDEKPKEPPKVRVAPDIKPAPIIKCEECGQVIVPIKRKDGSVMTAEEAVAFSRETFSGHVFCMSCMKKVAERNRKAKANVQTQPA